MDLLWSEGWCSPCLLRFDDRLAETETEVIVPDLTGYINQNYGEDNLAYDDAILQNVRD